MTNSFLTDCADGLGCAVEITMVSNMGLYSQNILNILPITSEKGA